MSFFVRRATASALLIVSMFFGLGSIASADPGVTVEPVTASSSDHSEITFTNGGTAAKVDYGRAENELTNSVSLVPNQVITVTVKDADTIYWQATSEYGTSPVHHEDTDDNTVLIIILIWVGAFVLMALFGPID